MKKTITLLFIMILAFGQSKAQQLIDKNLYKNWMNIFFERVNSKEFNYEDKDILITVKPDEKYEWEIKIYNKTAQEMVCKWPQGLFVIGGKSYGILGRDYNHGVRTVSSFSIPYRIAPESYIEYSILPEEVLIYSKKQLKKQGPQFIRLIIPISINGEEKTFDFKYKAFVKTKEKKR